MNTQAIHIPAAMPPIPLVIHDGKVFATSRIVAESFDRQHKNVIQAIERTDCSEEFGRLNFQPSSYLNMQGKEQPMYELTRDGFMFLVMGFTGPRAAAIKEAFIAQFNQMELMLRGGDALPEMARAITQTQALVADIAERQTQTDEKINAILSLVDMAGKYVELLEKMQRRPRKVHRRVMREDEGRARALREAGFSGKQTAEQLGLSESTVCLLVAGKYPFSAVEGVPHV